MERDAAEAFEGVRVEYEEAISAERAAEQARWWQSDRAAKYSWAALQRTELPGWSVVDGQLIETSAVKSGSQSRPAMLSDYWAEEAGALIEAPDKTKWTRVHCPLVWDGKPTEKAGWDDAKRLELANAVSAKLQSAGETQFHRGWMDPRIDGADRRAQLQGTVLFAAPKAPSGKRTSATFEDAAFCGEANFIGHTFAPNVNFSRALFAGIASFHKCAFKGRAEFAGALFLNYASFDRAHFIGEAKFEAASFHGDAIFKDALIRSGGSFRDASFFGVAPFQGARLHADTSFDSVRVSPLERALRTSSEVFWQYSLSRRCCSSWR